MKRYTVSADLTAEESGRQIKAVFEQLAASGIPYSYIRHIPDVGFEFAVPESPEDEAKLDPIRDARSPSIFSESRP